jgi:hypothetical protein
VYANLISCSNFSGGRILFKYALFALVWFKGWFGSSRPNINSPVGSWVLVVVISSSSSTYQQTQPLFNVWKQLDKS